MSAGINAALTAINQPLRTKDDEHRELSELMMFEQKLENEDQKEMAAQAQYTAYEESVNSFSENLLEGDRNQIRNKAKDLQGQLQKQIAKAGSYKKFMEQGGIRALSQYRNKVANSEEALLYKDNAINMAKIIKARDSGFAGRLTLQDRANLANYEKEGHGKITYSGLMDELEMPNAGSYELGTQVPATDILKNKNNYSAALSNYMMEYPEKGTPTGEELTKYVEDRFGIRGSNTAILQLRESARKSAAKNAAGNKKKAEKTVASLFTNKKAALHAMNGASNGGKETGFDLNSETDYNSIFKRGGMSNLVGDEFTASSETSSHGTLSYFMNETDSAHLKGARVDAGMNHIWKKSIGELESGSKNDNGTFTFNPKQDGFYGANGRKSEEGEEQDLTPVNVVYATQATGKNNLRGGENEKFFVVELDDDEDGNKEYIESMDGVKGYMVSTEVWRNKEGELFYREVPTDNLSYQQVFTTTSQKEDDISRVYETEQRMFKEKALIQARADMKNQQVKQAVNNVMTSSAFTSALDDGLMSKYSLPQSDDIFGTMALSFAMANKTYNAGRGTDGNYQNTGMPTAEEVRQVLTPFDALMTDEVLGHFKSKNMDMQTAYSAMSDQINGMEGTNREENDLFLTYWKSMYENQSGKTFKIEK